MSSFYQLVPTANNNWRPRQVLGEVTITLNYRVSSVLFEYLKRVPAPTAQEELIHTINKRIHAQDQ